MARNRPPILIGSSLTLARRAWAVAATGVVLTSVLGSPASADEWRDRQWHLSFLRADQVHKITKGRGVTVAVVDTGVDANHPDLKGNVLDGTDTGGGGDGRYDTDGHGTKMASLIAGHGHGPSRRDGILGLAPEAKILPVRDREEGNRGAVASAEGIEWAASHDAQVINFSGGSGGLEQSVQEAFDADVVVVAAAGNTAQDAHDVRAPARYPGVIAVSGIDRDGKFTNESAQGPEVVLAAPAVDLTGAGAGKRGKYNTGTGTSGATALVSATAALVRAKFPHLTAGGTINRLIKTADDKGPKGRDDKYGFGVINPLRALTADIEDVKANPLLPQSSASPTATNTDDSQASGSDGVDGDILVMLLVAAGLMIALTLAALGTYFILRDRRARTIAPQYGNPPLRAPPPAPPPKPPNHGATGPPRL